MFSSPFVCVLGYDSSHARSKVTWLFFLFYFEMLFSVAYFLVILKIALMGMFEQSYSGNFKLKYISFLKTALREMKYVNLKQRENACLA